MKRGKVRKAAISVSNRERTSRSATEWGGETYGERF